MSVTERQSLDYVESLVAANHAHPQLDARELRHRRKQLDGGYVVGSCIDARIDCASTMDPGIGPIMYQVNSFAGSSKIDRLIGRIFRNDIGGIVVASHWDEGDTDKEMGYGGCGARTAKLRELNGEPLHIAAKQYIHENVDPHCVEGAVNQARVLSDHVAVPCFAFGMSHITQVPHLMAAVENGKFTYKLSFNELQRRFDHPIPPDIQKRYPDIMAMLQQGRVFAQSQTPEEMQRRRVQDPHLVWVTGSHYPTWDVFGPSLGEIMRIGYYRDGNNKLRGGELGHIADHTSYPFYMATEGGHGFTQTNALLIDGREQQIYQTIWRRLKREPETNLWLDSDKRVVFGAVVRAGKIMSHERLY